MDPNADLFLSIADFLLLGLLTSLLGSKIILSHVTLLLVFGVLIGESFLDFIPAVFTHHFDLTADIALLMIGFLLGAISASTAPAATVDLIPVLDRLAL